jgi:serine/threonine protein kinase
MNDRVGQQFENDRLLRLLGRSGFAEVYLGQHLRLNTQAAVKLLHAQLTSADVEGFQRETQTIAALVHPHIVRVFDFDVLNDIPFLVMDYVPDGTLRQRHPRGSQAPRS